MAAVLTKPAPRRRPTGLVVFIEPAGRPGQRQNCNYQYIARIERR